MNLEDFWESRTQYSLNMSNRFIVLISTGNSIIVARGVIITRLGLNSCNDFCSDAKNVSARTTKRLYLVCLSQDVMELPPTNRYTDVDSSPALTTVFQTEPNI